MYAFALTPSLPLRVYVLYGWSPLKLKQNLKKNEVVTGRALFFVRGPFCTPYSICLRIDF